MQQNETQDTLLSAGDFWATPFYLLCQKLEKLLATKSWKVASYQSYLTAFKMEWWLSMSWARKGLSLHLSLISDFFNAYIWGSKMHAFHLNSHWKTHHYMWHALLCISLNICKTGSGLLIKKTTGSWESMVIWQSQRLQRNTVEATVRQSCCSKNPSQTTATRFIKPEALRPVHIYSPYM